MKYILVIGIIVFIVILFFLFLKTKNKQVFNNKSMEAEVDKKESADTYQKIISNDYNRYILLKNTTEPHLIQMIIEYGELSGNEEYEDHNFEIAKSDDWYIIKIPETIHFYAYHNLTGWLTGYEQNPNNPQFSIGLSNHKTDSQEDYIHYSDPHNDYGDTHIGNFRNGKSFSIYLPDAYEEFGNMIITHTKDTSFENSIKTIINNGFDILNIKTLNFKMIPIKMSVE